MEFGDAVWRIASNPRDTGRYACAENQLKHRRQDRSLKVTTNTVLWAGPYCRVSTTPPVARQAKPFAWKNTREERSVLDAWGASDMCDDNHLTRLSTCRVRLRSDGERRCGCRSGSKPDL